MMGKSQNQASGIVIPAPEDSVYVARQPILRATGHVFGYELLYRGAAFETACREDGDPASARTFTNALLNLGLDTLTHKLPAFINVNRTLLLAGAVSLLPPKNVVVELLEDMPIDRDVIEMCRSLHRMGYVLALDDFVPGSEAEALFPFVKFVKVDVLGTSPQMRLDVARRLASANVQLIAEKVETSEVAFEMAKAGYKLLQGFYFCRPTTFGSRSLPTRSVAYMNLLVALNQPDLCPGDLEDLIKQDISLSHRVLRCVNSAAFAIRYEVRSIRQALVLLGLDRIQRWASIWLLAGLNTGSVPETTILALVRSRSCELIGTEISPETGQEFFLLGLCSLLDTMLGRTMEAALADLPLSTEIRGALLGQTGVPRSVLDAVIAYERGAWEQATFHLEEAGLPSELLATAYNDGLRWANELVRSQTAA
jgi:EAL and modified HD-GYP domain-containing signal transduction protein